MRGGQFMDALELKDTTLRDIGDTPLPDSDDPIN